MLARLQAGWLRWRRRFSRAEWAARRNPRGVTADARHAPGLLLVQIDGLSREQLERALARRRMPFLRRLLRRRDYALHTHYSGLPSSTPAVQAELHYGVRAAVPAFSFLDRRVGRLGTMMHPEWAKRIEADLAAHARGLLQGGSSWSNIYTGGARQEESHFCAASVGPGDMWRAGSIRTAIGMAVFNFPVILRTVGLTLIELAIGIGEAVRGAWHGRRLGRELMFVFARVFVCVGLREMITLGGSIDLARGLPIVHVNFLGYDEQAHRRGPGSAFAHWTLKGIDRCVRRLYRAARLSGRRDYDVWIISDHGQVRTRQFGTAVDGGLEGLVRRHWPNLSPGQSAAPFRPQGRPSPGHWLGGPRTGRREAAHLRTSELSAFEKEEFAVAAMGPVGHVYFAREIGSDAVRRLAAALVRDGVPAVLLRRTDDKIVWLQASGEFVLPEQHDFLPHAPELRPIIARDLVELCRNPHAGDLVALGWAPGSDAWTFAEENGSHAGVAPGEVEAFALLPASAWLPPGEDGVLRPAGLRRAALHLIGRERIPRVREPVAQPAERERLRVITYNTHGCLGTDGRIAPARIARVLARYDPDVIALQELDAGRRRSRGEDQLALIAHELGLEHCYCPAVAWGDEHYGHGLLCRSPVHVVRRGRLRAGHPRWSEPREALWVDFEWNSRTIHLFGTHLGLGAAEQAAQVNDLLAPEWIGGLDEEARIILCGDFNLPPGSRAYRRLATRLQDVQAHAPAHVAQRTFPSLWPLRRIDHIFVSNVFAVLAVEVPRDVFTRTASDHLPVIADVVLQSVATPPLPLTRR